MGGAQPLAITMADGVCLAAEVEQWRAEKRIETRYLDFVEKDIDKAIDMALEFKASGDNKSIGVICTAVTLLNRLKERNIIPDVLTDQTSAHDPLVGYLPENMSNEEANVLRESNPDEYIKRSYEAMADHVRLMLEFQEKGAITFDYGNNLRGRALEVGVKNAFDFPGFVPAYIRPLFCEGKGPFRWAALSGDPADIKVTDDLMLELAGVCPRDRVSVGGVVDTRNPKKPLSTNVKVTGRTFEGKISTHTFTLGDETSMAANVCGPAFGYLKAGKSLHDRGIYGILTAAEVMPQYVI
jgi:urocanate hydratase